MAITAKAHAVELARATEKTACAQGHKAKLHGDQDDKAEGVVDERGECP